MLQTLTYKANVAPEGVPPVIRLSQNENGRVLIFDLVGTGTVNIPTGSVVTISGTKPDGVVYSAEGTLDGTSATFDEDTQMTAVAGEWPAKLRVTYDGETIASVKIWFAIDADPVRPGSVPSESELNGLVAEAQQYAESARSAAYGSPLTASTAAAMTNTDKVYVYTGSESGYLYGHWYYYNGTAWTDGGVYQSQGVQTDPTLTLEGVPADAKAAGDRIGAAEEDVADLKDALEVLQPTATSADVGKALIVKTVADGKATEYEYGEAGAPPIKDTASGAIASFTDGADNVPMDGVVVTMEPVQDLHGYDSPWPAGGGVNQNNPDAPVETFDLTGEGTYRYGHSFAGGISYVVVNHNTENVYYRIVKADLSDRGTTVTMASNTYRTANVASDEVLWVFANTSSGWLSIASNIGVNVGSVTTFSPYSNICPISGRTGVTVERTGKNLAQLEQGTINVSNGVEEASTTRVRTGFIAVETNVTYSTSSQNNGWSIRNGVGYDANKECIGNGFYPSPDTGRLTVTDSRVAYMRLIYSHTNTSETCAPSDYWYQLEKGSIATTYEPYQGTTIPVTFPTEAGTVYGGTVDAVRGVLTVDRAMVDMGSLTWQYESTGATRFYTDGIRSAIKAPSGYDEAANAISSIYANRTYNQFNTTEKANGTMAVSSSGWLSARNTAYNDATAFKTAMTGQTIAYELATPVTYQLDPQTLTSLLGQNNVWSDADSVSVEYTADTKLYISKVISAAVAALA